MPYPQSDGRATPPWALPLSAAAFLLGMLTVVLGPIALFALANQRAAEAQVRENRFDIPFQQQTLEDALRGVQQDYQWVFPVGCGVGFAGAIGLLLIWVSRPLGSDEDRPQGPPAPSG